MSDRQIHCAPASVRRLAATFSRNPVGGMDYEVHIHPRKVTGRESMILLSGTIAEEMWNGRFEAAWHAIGRQVANAMPITARGR